MKEEWGCLDETDSGVIADSREELPAPLPFEKIKRRMVTEWEVVDE